MAEGKPTQDTGINWAVVAIGTLALAIAVGMADSALIRVVAAVVIFVATIYMSRTREEAIVENPLLDQLRSQQQGLDRRKYGRLRSSTDRLLDHVRRMNRIAIDGREGRMAPRHAQAELDRLAGLMKDAIDDVRKSAGVPTPTEVPGERAGKVVQPKIVFPKGRPPSSGAEGAARQTAPPPAEKPAPRDETDRVLDALEAEAEAEAARRKEEGIDPGEA
ncbi:MAG: hypothetical protein JSU87_01315 [Gemmatimonadota bacterium]|nr:MAG: hypothetical protein JSU87_01315 [Gemmatimonadota bacterium]